MIQCKAVASLTVLSTLVFCAVAVQSTSAAVTTSKNTTTVTCVSEPKGVGDFKDAHCDETAVGKGAFTHQFIGSEEKEIDATNQKVTEETKKSEPIVLTTTVGLVKTEISCTTMETATNKSFVHNAEPEAGKHTFTGNGEAKFTKCTVLKPEKCTVNEPIVAAANFQGVEGLEGPKGEKNAMGVEFIGAGAEESFGEISFQGAECSLKGKTGNVKGKAYGTSGPTTESAQENKSSGATIVFTPKFKMEEMKFGTSTAEVNLIVTPTGTGAEPRPISITTPT
jgi:hypothetical protein